MFSIKRKTSIILKKGSAIMICLSMSLSLVVNKYYFANADEISTDTSSLEETPLYDIVEEETILTTDESQDNLEELTTEVPEISEDNLDELATVVPEISEEITEEVVLETPVVTEALTKELLAPRISATNGDLKPNNETQFFEAMELLSEGTSVLGSKTVTVDMSDLKGYNILLDEPIVVNPSIESLTFTNVENITLIAGGFRHFEFIETEYNANSISFNFGGMTLTGSPGHTSSGGIEIQLRISPTTGLVKENVIESVTIENCYNKFGNAIQITYPESRQTDFRIASVRIGSTLPINNVILRNNKNADPDSLGGAIYVNGATSDLNSYAEIYGNEAGTGGGIYASNYPNPSYYFYRVSNYGTIYSNTATDGDGGGVYCDNYSSPSDYPSRIYKNEAANNGGGVCVMGNSAYINGEISGNTAGENGGGVYAPYANTIIIYTYAKIDGNTAANGNGGGVYGKIVLKGYGSNLYQPEEFSFGGCSITKNSAPNGKGGGIYDGTIPDTGLSGLALKGTEIADNVAKYGGGIYTESCPKSFDYTLINSQKFTSVCIKNNKAEKGGGLYLNITSASPPESPLYLGNASIENNVAQLGGGAYIDGKNNQLDSPIYLSTYSEILQLFSYYAYDYGAIKNNIANSGGGIYASGKTFLILGGGSNISNNQAVLDLKGYGMSNISDDSLAGYGGGIYVDDEFNFDATENNKLSSILSYSDPLYRMDGSNPPIISGNKAGKSGGGIAVGNNAYLTLIDGVMENNYAPIGGGIGLIPATSGINLDKFDGNQNKANSTLFVFNGNRSDSEIYLDGHVNTLLESEKIVDSLTTKYPNIVTNINYFDKYSEKHKTLESDRFYNQTKTNIFNNNDVQYGKGTIEPDWKADDYYWYNEKTLGMTYKDIKYSVAKFDNIDNDVTVSNNISELYNKSTNKNDDYTFTTSGKFKGYVYGTENDGGYGVIIDLKTYNIDINPPTIIAKDTITPTENSITVKADFKDKHSGIKTVKIELLDSKNSIVKTVTGATASVSETFTELNSGTEYTVKYTVTDNAVDKEKNPDGNVLTLTSNTKTLSSQPNVDDVTDSGDGETETSEVPVISEKVEITELPEDSKKPEDSEKPVVSEIITSPIPTKTPSIDTGSDSSDGGSLIIPEETINPNTEEPVFIDTINRVRLQPSGFDDNIYIVLDENGVPLGFVELEPGEDLSSIDIFSRLQPLTDEMKGNIKANPKTGNNVNTNNYKYFIPVILAVGIYFIKKKKHIPLK